MAYREILDPLTQTLSPKGGERAEFAVMLPRHQGCAPRPNA